MSVRPFSAYSAYREAPAAEETARYIGLCEDCGQSVYASSSEPTFTCRACKKEHKLWREYAYESSQAAITFVSATTPSGYTQLKTFTESLGVKELCSQLIVQCNGVEEKITIETNSGTFTGITIEAFRSGLPHAKFRKEDVFDEDAKSSGVVRELQIGEPLFDKEIFIDSNVSDSDLLVTLRAPAVCDAIRFLVLHFSTVSLMNEGVRVTGLRDLNATNKPGLVASQVQAIRVVAGALSVTQIRQIPYRRKHRMVMLWSYFVLPLGVMAMIIGFVKFPICQPHLAILTLFIGLMVFTFFWIPFSRHALRGYSSSRGDIALSRGLNFVGVPLLFCGSALIFNGAFDSGQEQERVLQVTSISYDSDNDHYRIHGVDNKTTFGTHSYTFPKTAKLTKVGDVIKVQTKPGKFGYEWQSGNAILHTHSMRISE